MSDLPPPDRLGSRDAVRGVAGAWWLFLVLGVLWILFGMFVLSFHVGSLLALAIFAGVTFLMTGVNQVLAGIAAFDLRGLGRRLDQERPAV